MAERTKLKRGVESGGSYFASAKTSMEFVRTGSRLLDCALGGGWVLGRVSNVVGDKSTGKTLIAIEAAANFAHSYPKGHIFYRESEAAFDRSYAGALGMPLERVDFGKERMRTVEEVFADLSVQIKRLGDKSEPGLYIIDSLDALSDAEELERDMDKATYGAGKAKAMSELFRRLVGTVESSRIHLMFISQVRDNIGATFGRTWTRSGGRALDFYASHVVYLAKIATLYRTIRGNKRATGVQVRAKVDKNKIGLPFRECDFDIQFGYGIDDMGACLDWLKSVGHLNEVGLAKDLKEAALTAVKDDYMALSDDEFRDKCREIITVTETLWREIDQDFMPTRRKY